MKRFALTAVFVLALGLAACTESDSRAPEPEQRKAPAEAPAKPEPKPAAPVEQPAPPTDNCGLDPADMDHRTKVQCGLIEESVPAPGQSPPDAGESAPDCGPGLTLVPESPIGPYCDSAGGPAAPPPNADTPQDDGPGSMYTNPDAYRENTGEEPPAPGQPYSGTTSGDRQHQYGCDQGYIPPEQC